MTMLGGVNYYAKCIVYESDQTTGTDANDVAGDWSFIGYGSDLTKAVYIGHKVQFEVKIYWVNAAGSEFVVKYDGTSVVIPPATAVTVKSSLPDNASAWTTWVAANSAKLTIGATKVISKLLYVTEFSSKNNQSVTFTPAFVPKVEINGVFHVVEFAAGFGVPTIVYTKANKTVKPPSTVTAYDQIGSLQVGGGVSGGQAVQSETWYAWNSCESEWVRVWLSNPKSIAIAQGGQTDIEFDVSVKYFDAAGFKKRPDRAYLPKIAKPKQAAGVKDRMKTQHAPGSLTQEAKKELERARDCGISVAVSTPDGGGSGVDDSKYGGGRWNPPPHIITRHFSPIANSQDEL